MAAMKNASNRIPRKENWILPPMFNTARSSPALDTISRRLIQRYRNAMRKAMTARIHWVDNKAGLDIDQPRSDPNPRIHLPQAPLEGCIGLKVTSYLSDVQGPDFILKR
jgi:hypothetical protein